MIVFTEILLSPSYITKKKKKKKDLKASFI